MFVGETVVVTEAQQVAIDCILLINKSKDEGALNPYVNWYKNGFKVGNGTEKNVVISEDGRYCMITQTLLAVGGELGTMGNYTCEVCDSNVNATCINETTFKVVCGT